MTYQSGGAAATKRSISAAFSLKHSEVAQASVLNGIATPALPSRHELEQYIRAVSAPPLKIWSGPRQSFVPITFKLEIENLPYETSVSIPDAWLRRDMVGAYNEFLGGLARRKMEKWLDLAFNLINNGETLTGPDGEYYFDVDHPYGADGDTQANKADVTLSTLPVSVSGSTARPSLQEAAWALLEIITLLRGMKDFHGQPVNEFRTHFKVVTGELLGSIFRTAYAAEKLEDGQSNPLRAFKLDIISSPRSTFTTKFAVFTNEGRALIRQEEVGADHESYLGPGSDHYEKLTQHEHFFGIDVVWGMGYGLPEHAYLGTLV